MSGVYVVLAGSGTSLSKVMKNRCAKDVPKNAPSRAAKSKKSRQQHPRNDWHTEGVHTSRAILVSKAMFSRMTPTSEMRRPPKQQNPAFIVRNKPDHSAGFVSVPLRLAPFRWLARSALATVRTTYARASIRCYSSHLGFRDNYGREVSSESKGRGDQAQETTTSSLQPTTKNEASPKLWGYTPMYRSATGASRTTARAPLRQTPVIAALEEAQLGRTIWWFDSDFDSASWRVVLTFAAVRTDGVVDVAASRAVELDRLFFGFVENAHLNPFV